MSNKMADSTVTPPVHTLLLRLSENMKTLVNEEFNILQTDVFILCKMHLLEENKTVQTEPQNFGWHVQIVLGCKCDQRKKDRLFVFFCLFCITCAQENTLNRNCHAIKARKTNTSATCSSVVCIISDKGRCSARRVLKMGHFLACTCILVHTQRTYD